MAGFAAGGLAIAGGVAFRYARGAAADLYRRLVELDRTPPAGPLGQAELAALMGATQALLGAQLDERRYEDFFRWKAENAPGYRALYDKFREAADRLAAKGGAKSFAEADAAVKRDVLARAARVRDMINQDDKLGGLRFALFDREWLLFERYLVREVLTLFARTDAWLISGYGPHPGVPRGLEAYRQAPGGTGGAEQER